MTVPSSSDQPAYVDPVTGQPLFVDPVTGQLVYTDPAIPTQATYQTVPAYPPLPAYPPAAPTYPGYALPPGFPPAQPPGSGIPTTGYTAPAFTPASPGYPGYGYPMQALQRRTNSLAMTSMILSVVGAPLILCDDAGGVLGLAGAILGHIAHSQIKKRGEDGGSTARAGIIIGWIVAGIALAIVAVILIAIFVMGSHSDTV